MQQEYNYTPLPEPIPITEQVWPEGTLPLVCTSTLAYNHEPYIRECLDGILMQKTTFPVQVLVHEDCSTDRTAEILKEYQSKYPNLIKVFYQPENVYSLKDQEEKRKRREEFFSWRIGKYVALCEGDDYWIDPLKLQKQVDFLEANPEYGMCCTNYLKNNLKTKKKKIDNGIFLDRNNFEDYLIGKFSIATLTTCFRKDLLSKINYDYLDQNFLMGDYPMWLEMIRVCRIKYLQDVTACYNVTEESASHSNNLYKQLLFYKNIWEIRLYFAKKYNVYQYVTKINKNIIYFDSLFLMLNKQYYLSIKLFVKSNRFNLVYVCLYLKCIISSMK